MPTSKAADNADNLRYRLEYNHRRLRGSRLDVVETGIVVAALECYAAQVRVVAERENDPVGIAGRMSV